MITTVVDADGETIRIGTYRDVGDALGTNRGQACIWYLRRARNGFPEPYLYARARGRDHVPHFDLDACRVWRLYYVPTKPGPKTGTPPQS